MAYVERNRGLGENFVTGIFKSNRKDRFVMMNGEIRIESYLEKPRRRLVDIWSTAKVTISFWTYPELEIFLRNRQCVHPG
jgi:hypothetical protein